MLLKNCTLHKNLIIDATDRERDKDYKRFHIIKLDLTNSIFSKDSNTKVKIQFCDIDEGIFYNTKFGDLADFYQTKFNKVNFERTDFEKISVFSETEFNCNVDFKYTKFLGKTIFRDTVIDKKYSLNLRDAIFDDEANFLDITSKSRYNRKLDKFTGDPVDIKVSNRETARIIKNFYDNSNNIIEANRFYKLEMKEREKELVSTNKYLEYFTFKAHGIASDHSQDWLLSLFWIFNFTMGTHFITTIIEREGGEITGYIYVGILSILIFGTLIVNIPIIFRGFILISITLFIYVFYVSFFPDFNIEIFTKMVNPFSIMSGKEQLNSLALLYKIVMGYLIYQLIISVRQNTRRK